MSTEVLMLLVLAPILLPFIIVLVWMTYTTLVKPYIPVDYEMGTLDGFKARRIKGTNSIEFVLWKAGEQGHTKDYWATAGAGHEDKFVPDH